LKRVGIPLFLVLAALSLAACSQGKDEPCQVKSDCSSGLLCCPAPEFPRGLCVAADTCPETVIDAGMSEPSDGEDAGDTQSM
jgi:hypothetical protein